MKSQYLVFFFAAAAAGTLSTRASAQGADSTKAKSVTSFTGDLGFVSASGNTNVTTLTVNDKIVHTDGKWTLTQLGTYVSGETDNKQSANQLRFSGRVDYSLRTRLAVFLGASYERNTFAGFDSRTDEMLGLAWKAVVAPSDSLNIDAGGVLTQESDVDGTTQNYPAGRAALTYKHQFSKTAYFTQFVEYLPNLQTSGEYRFNTESALVAPISAHIGIKLGYAIRFDSHPQPTFGTTDRLLTTGVQISY